MAREKFILGGETFATKAEVKRRAQFVLKAGRIQPDDDRFLRDLFARHPSAAEKHGPGIAEIRVVTVPPWNTRGFQIVRVDGTSTDVSYLECLRPTGPDQWFRAACRTAVRDQIEAARRAAFVGVDSIRCPVTGDVVTVFDGHVDHAPPWTFEAIVSDFLVKTGLDPASLSYEDGDNVVAARFVDRYLEEEFAELHRQIAVLRVVSVRANLSVLRRGHR
jgi:hypothetical protein